MKPTLCLASTCALICNTAFASNDFGSEQDAQNLAMQLSQIIADDGIDAAIAAVHDPNQPFASSTFGVHVFESSVIVAKNHEPDLIAVSYSEAEDLTGETMWPRIVAAANVRGDATLISYHSETQAVYTYKCYSEWAQPGIALVMVCR